MATGTITAFAWTASILFCRTSVMELIALTTLWALVVAGWLNFIALVGD
jgi:hypothetical protein